VPIEAGNPFLDDVVPEATIKAPAVPKEARLYRGRNGQRVAIPRDGRPVIVGPVKVSPPRPLNPQASTRMKAVKVASYQAEEAQPVATETRKAGTSTKSRKAGGQNPLRNE
jgi:hypothetical protein